MRFCFTSTQESLRRNGLNLLSEPIHVDIHHRVVRFVSPGFLPPPMRIQTPVNEPHPLRPSGGCPNHIRRTRCSLELENRLIEAGFVVTGIATTAGWLERVLPNIVAVTSAILREPFSPVLFRPISRDAAWGCGGIITSDGPE